MSISLRPDSGVGYARFRSPDPGSDGGGGTATVQTSGEYDYDDTLFDNDLQDQQGDTIPESEPEESAAPKESNDTEVDEPTKNQEQSPSSRQEPSKQPDEDEESVTDNDEAAAQPQFDSGLLERAGRLGFTYTDVQSLGSNDALTAAVRREEALHQRWQENERARQEAANQAGAETKQEDSLEPEEPPFDEWIEKGYDKGQVEVMRKEWQTSQELKQRLGQLEADRQQERQLQMRREGIERENRFDERVASLGDEYSDLFGTQKSSTQLDRTSPEFQNRSTLFAQMNRLAAGYQATGEPVPTEQELFNEAIGSKFGTRQTELARKEVTAKLKKAGKQAISRPGKTRPKPQTGEEQAAQFAGDWFRERGESDFDASIEFDDEI